MGSNVVKLASTTARALKEKDDRVYCQPELLYEGKMPPFRTLREGAGPQESPEASQYLLLMQKSCAWTRGKRKGSWGAPVESIWGQFSFAYLQTPPRRALGVGVLIG